MTVDESDSEQAGETDSGYVSPDEYERAPEHYDLRAQESRARIVSNALNDPKL